jgi:hypothetical protein
MVSASHASTVRLLAPRRASAGVLRPRGPLREVLDTDNPTAAAFDVLSKAAPARTHGPTRSPITAPLTRHAYHGRAAPVILARAAPSPAPEDGGSRGRRPEMRPRRPGLPSSGPPGSRIQQAPSGNFGAITAGRAAAARIIALSWACWSLIGRCRLVRHQSAARSAAASARSPTLRLDVGRPNDLTPSAGPVDYDLARRGNNHATILR